jgi:hypothetical protein
MSDDEVSAGGGELQFDQVAHSDSPPTPGLADDCRADDRGVRAVSCRSGRGGRVTPAA